MTLRTAFLLLLAALAGAGCATRNDYETFARAERNDLDGALAAARAARGGGIDGWFFGTGASECRDYEAVVTVLVAQGDFRGAWDACTDYDDQCAVVPDGRHCFIYQREELAGAAGDEDLAEAMSRSARQALHFRWLMIRDDYEGRPPRRPIY
jgi:hypothetical protein